MESSHVPVNTHTSFVLKAPSEKNKSNILVPFIVESG